MRLGVSHRCDEGLVSPAQASCHPSRPSVELWGLPCPGKKGAPTTQTCCANFINSPSEEQALRLSYCQLPSGSLILIFNMQQPPCTDPTPLEKKTLCGTYSPAPHPPIFLGMPHSYSSESWLKGLKTSLGGHRRDAEAVKFTKKPLAGAWG